MRCTATLPPKVQKGAENNIYNSIRNELKKQDQAVLAQHLSMLKDEALPEVMVKSSSSAAKTESSASPFSQCNVTHSHFLSALKSKLQFWWSPPSLVSLSFCVVLWQEEEVDDDWLDHARHWSEGRELAWRRRRRHGEGSAEGEGTGEGEGLTIEPSDRVVRDTPQRSTCFSSSLSVARCQNDKQGIPYS